MMRQKPPGIQEAPMPAYAQCGKWVSLIGLLAAAGGAGPSSRPGGGLLTLELRGAAREPAVRAELVADAAAIEPGRTFTVGVLFRIREGWHIYWKSPGEAGLATEVTFTLPKGFQAGPLRWPAPTRFSQPGDIVGFGYSKAAFLTARVKAPSKLPEGGQIPVTAEVSWLECEKRCVPGHARLAMSLPVARASAPANEELFAEWEKRLPVAPASQKSPLARVEVEGAIPPGKTAAAIRVHLLWKRPPASVEWFPHAPRAISVTAEKLRTDGRRTWISFDVKLLSEDAAAARFLESVVTCRDAKGRLRAASVAVPLRPPPAAKGKTGRSQKTPEADVHKQNAPRREGEGR
jgi:DsbC/DsbD-like thiol-disulfide interchange protein